MKVSQYFKGSYLRAADLPRPLVATIAEVREELLGDEKEAKPVVYFRGVSQGLVLNKVNCDTLTAMFDSDDSDLWLNQRVELYNDPSVVYGNSKGGIRIRAPQKPRPPQSELEQEGGVAF